MFKYNNNHIFTGYLKQLLSSFSLPACKIYTREFAEYFDKYGKEDPRVLESFDNIKDKAAVRINYLRSDEIYHYFCKYGKGQPMWRRSADLYYSPDKVVHGLTRNLSDTGIYYDTKTHEYLGDYLRFIRDYYNVNLMSLYNCFTDKIYNNIYFSFKLNPKATENQVKITFDAQNPEYKVYALPVKLFEKYTIAVDCDQGVEMFCGLYNTRLDLSDEAEELAARTYYKVNKALFKQPFIYDKLDVAYWKTEADLLSEGGIRSDRFTRWDIANREKDLRLFIKVPISCRSSITILEGDYRSYNDVLFAPKNGSLVYQQNHTVLNFNTAKGSLGDKIDLNNYAFKPISKLQLLALNTGESYPFADRLVEYLTGSAITPLDEINDNIKRVQRVMQKTGNYFKIEGLWEDKMQNILYDYMMNSGPVEMDRTTQKIKDRHTGYHPRLGHNSKSTQYDILGYVDKDTEKLYASWKLDKDNNKARVATSLQNVDIYDGLYDI